MGAPGVNRMAAICSPTLWVRESRELGVPAAAQLDEREAKRSVLFTAEVVKGRFWALQRIPLRL